MLAQQKTYTSIVITTTQDACPVCAAVKGSSSNKGRIGHRGELVRAGRQHEVMQILQSILRTSPLSQRYMET